MRTSDAKGPRKFGVKRHVGRTVGSQQKSVTGIKDEATAENKNVGRKISKTWRRDLETLAPVGACQVVWGSHVPRQLGQRDAKPR